MAKIAIVGYGKQGHAGYEYWRSDDNQITVCDKDELLELPADVESQLGPDHLKNLDSFDLIVRSPIVHPRDIVAANSPAILEKVTTVTNEFFRVCPSRNIIGVTGTKGKGTTSTMIAKMLEAVGIKVHLGGNIGTPPLELLKAGIKEQDYVVLELANFQLIDLKYSPHIAVCLMVVPEHLDWHADMDEYTTAKQQLFIHQKSDDIAIYYTENEVSEKVASVSAGLKIPYFKEPGALVNDDQIKIGGQAVCRTDELKLLGKHNWQNVCAALTAVWQITQDTEAIKSILTNFAGLEHRLELVRQLDGIKFYNDSFAVTPDAAMAAIESISGTKVLIAGGFDRNLPLGHFAKAIKQNEGQFRKLVIIGASAWRFSQELEAAGFKNYQICKAKTMPEVVDTARSIAQSGDSVVLSPGFPSFDMFKNYEMRGFKFKEAVNAL